MPYDTVEKQRAWVEANRDKVRANARNYARRERAKNPGCFYHYFPYDAKQRARRMVSYAIIVGKLTKEPCRICGDLDTIAHHEDYSKPLKVWWLCRVCHETLHKEKNN